MSLVRFKTNGEVVFIYEDDHPCLELGERETRRVSHIEPKEDGLWQTDMSPLGGGLLTPQETRSRAIELEIEWILNKVVEK